MPPRDWALWMHARYVVTLYPNRFSWVNKVYTRLQEARMILHNSGADFNVPCARDSRHACELQRQMKQWNCFLAPINVQLTEENCPGEFAVQCFEGCIYVPDRECRVQRAVLMFHWLLMKHSCVTALRVNSWGVFESHEYFPLFYAALHECRRLKSFKVCMQHPEPSAQKLLLASMRHLRHLEEFTCDTLQVNDETKTTTAFCDILTTNSKLVRLEVKQFNGSSSGLCRIVQNMSNCTDLYLDVGRLESNDADSFLWALKQNGSLKSLRLVGSFLTPTVSAAAIARATEYWTQLTTLELSCFHLTNNEVSELARALCHNNTVQNLALLSCWPAFSYQTRIPYTEDCLHYGVPWSIQPFLQMLRELTSVRKLAVPVTAFPMQPLRMFFEALAANDFVEEVRIENPNQLYSRQLCQLIRETDTGDRVRIDTVRVDETSRDSASEGAYIRDVWLHTHLDTTPEELHGCLTQLPRFDMLTTLCVDVEGGMHNAESAEFLSQYLRNTKLLNDVTLMFSTGIDESLIILDALSQNTSITRLRVEGWCLCRHATRILADVVCSSKSIRALTYDLESCSSSSGFIPALAKRIEGNRTILSVKAFRPKAVAKDWNFIQGVLGRNNTLLIHAARCVTGCAVQKSGAEALEVQRFDPMLVAKVQEMASVDENEAKDAIRSRLVDLENLDFFMSVSGVVRERVVCEESAEGRPTLDTIPPECWIIVRRHLRVADVVKNQEC